MRQRKDRVDSNQASIVKTLRKIPGMTVQIGMDDIICGYKGVTYWFEIKNPDCVGKDGNIKPSSLKPSQVKLLREFTGHYSIVWNVEQIIKEIGIFKMIKKR